MFSLKNKKHRQPANLTPANTSHQPSASSATAPHQLNKKPIQTPSLEDWLGEWEKVDWLSKHGELAVDVYETAKDIVVKSAVAGIKPQDIDISINHDVLTIRGKRHDDQTQDQKNYLFQECYWGNFSRTVVLPSEVESDKIKAILKNGILTVTIPKIHREKIVKVQEITE